MTRDSWIQLLLSVLSMILQRIISETTRKAAVDERSKIAH